MRGRCVAWLRWFDKAQRFKERWNETLESLDESWAERDAAREALRELVAASDTKTYLTKSRFGLAMKKARKELGDE